MMSKSLAILSAFAAAATTANAHIAFWDPSMWGYNVSAQSYGYDNRPMVPLMDQTFDEWWFHGHLDHPPHQGDFFELPAGQTAVSQLACNKGATKWWAASEGTTDIRQGDYPCPNSPLSAFHTTGEDDLKGCALAITYNSDVNSVQPEDFAVFSVNHKCVWNVNTGFAVPADMPPCPEGGCICAWFWIHSVDSGSEQNYMNGFRCKVTGSKSSTPIAKPQLARRCGAEPEINKKVAPGNCTEGPKQPFYWYQKERNNMPEGQYSPPYYNELYNFMDGAQNDIFEKRDGSANSFSTPAPSSSYVSSPAVSSSPVSAPAPPSSTHVSSSVPPPVSSSVAPPPASSPAPPASNHVSSSVAPPPVPQVSSIISSSVVHNPPSSSLALPISNHVSSSVAAPPTSSHISSSVVHHSPSSSGPASVPSSVISSHVAPAPGTTSSPDAQSSPTTLYMLNPSLINTPTDSAHYGAPSPSGKSRSRSSAEKRRQEAVARHFKRRLNDYHH